MTTAADQERLESAISNYDKMMVQKLQDEYYGHSGFYNFGYWSEDTQSQREASENLVNRLLEWIPAKHGTILDVACGLGATTKMLLDHYPPPDVFALNYSAKQVGIAGRRAPGCGFVGMDAVSLGFRDEAFDNVICVEAAFHFNTRVDFFREAFRVLKPGGRLVFSDLLFNRWKKSAGYMRDPAALTASLRSIGFQDVEVEDATRECWLSFKENVKRWPGQERRAGRLSLRRYLALSALSLALRSLYGRRITYYVLATARKPL